MKKSQKYTADFETANWENEETYVWAWAICNIETEEIQIGTDITTFFTFCMQNSRKILYA